MAVAGVFCQEDSGGPLSKDEALRLIHLMYQRALEDLSENQVLNERDPKHVQMERRSIFDMYSGMEQALCWAEDVLKRVVLDPTTSLEALKSSAEELERTAANLRRLAGDPTKP